MIEILFFMLGGEPNVLAALGPMALSSIMSLIGAGISAGISAKKAADGKKQLEKTQAKTDKMYDSLYYQDILKRADTQNLITQFENNQQKENKRTAASNLINGATPEVAIAQKQASANAYANMISDITGRAAALKDNYRLKKAESAQKYGEQMAGISANEGQQWAKASQNFGGIAVKSATGAIDKYLGKTITDIGNGNGDGDGSKGG